MQTESKIRIEEYCDYCKVDISFIKELNTSGLINLVVESEQLLIEYDQIPTIEKYCRMHYEMSINIEGIEVIHHLLHKISDMQQEINMLKLNINLTTNL